MNVTGMAGLYGSWDGQQVSPACLSVSRVRWMVAALALSDGETAICSAP